MRKFCLLFVALFSTMMLWANVISGICGENLTWTYDAESHALAISGTGDMWDYSYDNCPWSTVSSAITSVSLPYGLTHIGSLAFYNCRNLTFIELPETLLSIEHEAFRDAGLKSIVIPNSVYTIRSGAFEYTNLSYVILPNGLEYIDDNMFSGCEYLSSITIPASVMSIASYALNTCNDIYLESSIPASITSSSFKSSAILHVPCSSVSAYESAPYWQFLTILGNMDYAFNLSATEGGTAKITKSVCAANTVVFEAIPNAGWRFTGWSDGSTDNPRTLLLTADKSITAQFEYAPNYCQVELSGFDYLEGDGVGYQRGPNFSGQVIEGGYISVRAIENCGTFTGWSDGISDSYRSIRITQDTTISANYTGIETYTVSITAGEHGHLSQNVIGEVTSCANHFDIEAIADEGYHFVEWSDGNENRWRYFDISSDLIVYAIFAKGEAGGKLGENLYWAFEADKNQITVSGNGEMTERAYFADDKYKSALAYVQKVVFEEGASSVIMDNFNGLHYLETLSLPASLMTIGESAFEDCRSLQQINFAAHSNLTTIGDWAFYNCHELTKLTLPEGVTSIGKAAFYGCAYLSELSLPASMVAIADNAFALCAKMKYMKVKAVVPPEVAAKTFESVSREIPVYVPSESLQLYKDAAVWQEFFIQPIENAPQGIDEILESSNPGIMKFVRNGQLFILRNGEIYNAQGARVE